MSLAHFIFLLAIINPFAQVMYLWELVEVESTRRFERLYRYASLLTLGVFALMAFIGKPLIETVFQIDLADLQIFGGVVIFWVGLRAVVGGEVEGGQWQSTSDVSSRIALPYQIGPGTIWISILIGASYPPWIALAGIALTLAVNHLLVLSLVALVRYLYGKPEWIASRFMLLLMRTNSLFVGAIGVHMIVHGVLEVVTTKSP